MTTKSDTLFNATTTAHTVALFLLCVAAWTLFRPYAGLVYDAQLYALQALATLRPEVFSGDIFLKYGSQNDFTFFPRIYALLVRAIGLERATALLTLTCSIAWLVIGWWIARRLSNRRMAWVALGLLISIKAWYGAYHVFRSGEMFLSARLPAEVLALAAIAAFLSGRRMLAGVLVLISGMLHPIMAMPVALLFVLMLAEERWGARSLKALFPTLILGGTAATFILSGVDPANNDAWIVTLQSRSQFLFPADWRLEDWQHTALVLATIGLACSAATSETLSRFACSILVVGLSGIGLAAIAGALPEHNFLLKVQPWRWLWLAVVAAIMLLPGTVESLWREETLSARRTCAILLLSSWLIMDTYGGTLALATLGIFWTRPRTLGPALHALRAGAWLVLAATFASAVLAAFQSALYPFDTNSDPRWIQRMVNALPTNSSAVAAVLVCWVVIRLAGRARLAPALGVLGTAVLVILLMPRALRTWTTERFTPAAHVAFAPWRAIIPETSEVLWPINPTGVWILLERRSYMSGDQLAGLLYSPRLITEMSVRAEALKGLADPGWWTLASESEESAPKTLTPALLNEICRAPGLDFLVDDTQIDGYVAKATFPVERVDVYLYDCRVLGRPGNAT